MHHNEILGSGLPVITEQLHPIGNNKHETWEEKKKKKDTIFQHSLRKLENLILIFNIFFFLKLTKNKKNNSCVKRNYKAQ